MISRRVFHYLSRFRGARLGRPRLALAFLLVVGVGNGWTQNSEPPAKPEDAPAAAPAPVTPLPPPLIESNRPPAVTTNLPIVAIETNAVTNAVVAPTETNSVRPMTSNSLPALAAAAGLTNRLTETAPRTNSAAKTDYASFKILLERNIFDPTRYARSSTSSRTRPTRRVRTEAFGLVGTISYDKGTIAFFDGSGSEYRKALKVGDSIAGHTVAEIAPDSVKLQTAGHSVELHIGAQMRRPEQGEWAISGNGEPFSSLNSTNLDDKGEGVEDGTDTGTPTVAPSTSPASSGAESDILKRLMQKREQELNK